MHNETAAMSLPSVILWDHCPMWFTVGLNAAYELSRSTDMYEMQLFTV